MKLTRDEKAKHRTWLSEWHAPVDVADHVEGVNCAMGSAHFFCQGGVEFLRDAWLAAKFGLHRQSPLVRLVPEREQWPDFEAKADEGIVERVECVEADIPGRRRGDEFDTANPCEEELNVEEDPIEDCYARAAQVPAALAAAIATKIGKNYGGGTVSLLIYLNIQESGVRQAEIEAEIGTAALSATSHFRRIWVLWKDRLYGPGVAGQP